MSTFAHIPVLCAEVLTLMDPARGGVYVDGTLGGGGHAEAVLRLLPPEGHYYGIDRDPAALSAAGERLRAYKNFTAVRGNFFAMQALLRPLGVEAADGILLDLGVSSYQLDTAERGFSYQEDAPLDMRMDPDAPLRAYDVVNAYDAEALARILRDYGEERFASRIANAIVRARADKPIERTCALAELVRRAVPAQARYAERQHPARRTFQALRIEVNGELAGLETALEGAHALLRPGGVLCVITFHSLEDRIVKQTFRRWADPCTCDRRAPICTCGKTPTVQILTRKPVIAGEAELAQNTRAHSAKLRAVRKL